MVVLAFQLRHFVTATACQFVCCLVFYESYMHVIELLANGNLKIGNFVISDKTNITSFKCKWAQGTRVGPSVWLGENFCVILIQLTQLREDVHSGA